MSQPEPVTPATTIAPPISLENEILQTLDAPQLPGEPIDTSFRRKEAALCDLFAMLSLEEAFALEQRLRSPKEGDVLAAKFSSRLAVERRGRLISFLADARRRAIRPTKRK